MVSKDKGLLKMIRGWQGTNIKIAKKQLEEMSVRREAIELEMGDELVMPELNIPNWQLTFQVTHPICHEMIKLINSVNAEIKVNERLFFAGVMDEEGLERVKREALSTMSGVIDRIAKATSPGKRVPTEKQKGGYSPAQLAAHIRKGFRLDFADAPQTFMDLIAEYEESTSSFKTNVSRKPTEENKVTEEKKEPTLETKTEAA